MRVIVTDSYEEMSMAAAKVVAGQIYLKPDSVLGLATGSTPLMMYGNLVAVHQTIGLDFSEVTSFNLDEYIGLTPDNPQSYHYFMQQNFFSRINIKLVDFKIEFGRTSDGRIVLADEVSPDTCRLWDATTNERLDKDRFRRDLGRIREAYEEILARLTKITE